MEEASGASKVMAEIKPSMNHLRFSGKLRGCAGSSWASHPTRLLSKSDRGHFSIVICCFLLLFRERCFSSSLPRSSWG